MDYNRAMPTPILTTKIAVPPSRPSVVQRPGLMQRLDSGVRGRLVLVSAPAGFGKSTTLSEWVAGCGRLRPEIHPAWLSLDAADGDPARFLAYVVAALRTAAAEVGEGALRMLQSPSRRRPRNC